MYGKKHFLLLTLRTQWHVNKTTKVRLCVLSMHVHMHDSTSQGSSTDSHWLERSSSTSNVLGDGTST